MRTQVSGSDGGTTGRATMRSDAAARVIGRTRIVVFVAVAAVLLVAVALFLIGAGLAVAGVWQAARDSVRGEVNSTDLTIDFLEVVSTMLKAVIFYIVGIGLYSLFITPLNLAAALGLETLNDLEEKVISVIIVVMAVTFLEHFIGWDDPDQILRYGGALAIVVGALVAFQWVSHRSSEAQKVAGPEVQVRAQRELFERDHEEREISQDEVAQAERPEAKAGG